MSDDRPVTRRELEGMLQRYGEDLLGTVLELVGQAAAATAVRKALARKRERNAGVPEDFIKARSVILSRPHLTRGDPGFRGSPADVLLDKIGDPDNGDARPGGALAAIRARRRGGTGED